MTREFVINEYFRWMCRFVFDRRYSVFYNRLLRHLSNREFVYILGRDANRTEDGIDLRYRFGRERHYPEPMIADYLDDKPCSVLEMMVALAIRCEDQIMEDPDIGNRTAKWFWNMIFNLGLGDMTDGGFNPRLADKVLERFLNREYDPDGKGGLFTVRNYQVDMRSVEIWYQMCWYLDEVLET